MSNTDWWIPRPGTVFLRSQYAVDRATYEESREEWEGVVLGNFVDEWNNATIMIRREDTGEELNISGTFWWNATNNIWKGDNIEVIWAPGWTCFSRRGRSRIGGPCG
jgi:hypothetical protein